MLVDNSVYKNSYTGTGTTTEFPITFPFLENKHIQVIQSTDNGITESEVPSSDYTISGAGLESGGTCTFKVAPQAGVLIIIRRNVPITQLYAYKELDNFPAESHENALAKLTMIDQQQQEQINRALKVSGASQQSPEELMDELFQIRDDSEAAQSAAEAAQSAAEAAQSAAEDCRDTACECASQAQSTLDSAVQVIQNQESISKNAVIAQEQASVSVVQSEGDEQAKRLEDIATTILVSAASYNKSVSVKLTSAITSGETYTLPESLAYLVGRSQLLVSGNGVWFYKDFQYNEVGTDGVASTQIKFLQDLAIDDVLTFTILANSVNVLTATNSGLVNDADGHLKLNVDGQTVLINASGQVYVPVMTGATASSDGTSGNVPAPQAGDQDRPLTGGGIYATSIKCAASSLNGILLSQVEDTPNWWREKGNAIFAVDKIGLINNQPSQYGTIINTAINGELQQIYIVQPDGEIYKRGANATGWNGKTDDNGTWHRVSNTMPVGSIYVQFSGQAAPADLFGGTWENVSFIYADQFFRAEGAAAATFGHSQDPGLPNIVAIGTGYWRSTHVSSPQGGAAYTIYDQGDIAGSGSNPENIRTGAIDASKYNPIYGATSEVRPRNSTIRIWKRTA